MIKKLSILSKVATTYITLIFHSHFLLSNLKKIVEILDSHGIIESKAKIQKMENQSQLFAISIESETIKENLTSLKKELRPYLYGIR